MRDTGETIAAIATAQGTAGIGIIRISGPGALSVGDALYRNRRGERTLTVQAAGALRYGFAVGADGDRIDEIMAAVFRAPRSYTGEDMVELQCHGGLFVLRRVLEAVFAAGARPAGPGEFTKRAFLNGRIDLAQAEAVMDVIAAESDFALKNAGREIGGALSARIRELREKLLHESAFIEAALDDPESFSGALEGYEERLLAVIRAVSAEIDELLSHADDGILLREGVRCAIVGLPNAGKSSLLNLLAGRERAIVSAVPGTTRDTVEERVRVGELTLHLIDTAGIVDDRAKEADAGKTPAPSARMIDAVERIGVERARQALAEAELVLLVTDATEPISEEVLRLLADTAGKRRILIANKTDLLSETNAGAGTDAASDIMDENTPTVYLSAKTGEGLDDLREQLMRLLITDDSWRGEDVVVANVRHKRLLEEARVSLRALSETIGQGLTEDFYTVDLMNAYHALGGIIGEEVGDDLVEKIFSKFCMGK